MLAEGGNAVDAAIATAITLTLVEPVSNGIGSDAFAIVWDGQQLHGLNASGRSPAAWTPEYFCGKDVPILGWNSVTVPGAVSAWVDLHAKFGKLPFERLFGPAIAYGRNGFLVSPKVSAQWQAQVALFADQPGFAEAFLPGGRAPRPGELFTFPDHADTLEKIAASTGQRFTEASWPTSWKRTRGPMTQRCAPAIWPRTAPTGSAPSAQTTATTPSTRFRPTARASWR